MLRGSYSLVAMPRLVPVLIVASVALVAAGCGGTANSTAPKASPTQPIARAVPKKAVTLHVVERPGGTLQAPLEDPASAAVGAAHALLIGGLTAADTSTDDVRLTALGGARTIGRLPVALHDSAAASLGDAVYLFGGGSAVHELDAIERIDPRTGAVTTVARLPVPASDVGAAAVGSTAYVVGGYTGTRWLNTIVAWRPGAAPRVVAHLPYAVRYSAVTAAGGLVVIAGGSLANGTASSAVLGFDPTTNTVRRLGSLPNPTTHAAAAAIGGIAYVVGGRGAIKGSATSAIVGVDPVGRRVFAAGTLLAPRSDLAAVSLPGRILIAGGSTGAAVVADISELVPGRATAVHRRLRLTGAGVYAYTGPSHMTAAARAALPRIYVPNSKSDTVSVINPATFRVIAQFPVGALPQHVTPSWDMRTLWVDNDLGNSLTPINPRTGKPGRPVPVTDPYNLYFTPDGRYAIVVAERFHQLDFRNPHTMRLVHSLVVPCTGVDHMDFSADGTYLIASCEFSGQMIKVDLASQRVVGTLSLGSSSNMPQDVKLSPDGRIFYVADMMANGVWKVNGDRMKVIGFVRTGTGAHGLYPSRNARFLYVTNRGEGSISVLSFATGKVVKKWRLPGGGSPDMGGVSVDGKTLWVSGRYNAVVYAIDTRTGRLRAKIPVGSGPHGLSVWPQPGRYSLGHTGITR
jgi:YVTN family beta-propeller protein